jgi:hypothetical protein
VSDSRSLASLLLAEIAKQNVHPVIFAQAEFTSGTVHVWSGIDSISWNSQTWTGLGGFLAFSPITESTEVRADGVEVSLSGIKQSLLTSALSEIRQGRPAKIYFGCMDSSGAVIVDPYQCFSGRIDSCTIDEQIDGNGEATCTITLMLENRLIDFQRSRERRYTNQDQQMEYPGDLGFEFVEQIQDWNGQAGNPGSGVPNAGVPNSATGASLRIRAAVHPLAP